MIARPDLPPTTGARWWRREGEAARCQLCPHACLLSPGETGCCRVRVHVHGTGLVTENYGMAASMAVDPVEKKPLYHWKPGTEILSIGSVGCNMNCPFCQNWPLAERSPSVTLTRIDPRDPARIASERKIPSVAFTYNEPLVWLEFILDACPYLAEEGIPVALVSNGMINPSPLKELLPRLAAANIDLKAFDREAYRFMGGDLETVKRSIMALVEFGVHVETTFLLVPGINDDPEEFERMTEWLSSLDPTPVLHISRYFPNRRWREPPTSLALLEEFERIARGRLPWVYRGNTDGESNTICSSCGIALVRRHRLAAIEINLDDEGRCSRCHHPSPIVL